MLFDSLVSALWLTGMGLQIVLGVVLITKKSWRKFPVFTAFCIVSMISDVGLYALIKSSVGPVKYKYGYAFDETVTSLLGLGVVYEIFTKLFAPYAALRKMAKLFFQWGLAALVLLDICVAYSHNAINVTSITETTVVLQQVTCILVVGLLLFVFLFATAFGLHWRQSVFGIALGLGISQAVELIGITVVAHFGKAVMPEFNIVNSVTFSSVLLVWMSYFLMPERIENRNAAFKLPQLEQWNQAIMELIRQ
jgi:hypothetical protein